MRERRDAMMAGMRHMPEGTRCVPPAGGFFCWLTLPEGMSADALFARRRGGRRRSTCAAPTASSRAASDTLRLAYSGVSPAEIEEGMARLGAVFRAAAAAPAAA